MPKASRSSTHARSCTPVPQRGGILLPLDTATVRRARVVYREQLRLKRIPQGLTFTRWMADGVRERMELCWHPTWPEDPQPSFHQVAETVSDGFLTYTAYVR